MAGEHARAAPWRWATPPTPGRRHYGGKIGLLSHAMGRPPMPWQRDIAQVATEIDPDSGEWAYPTVIMHIQRQAGKTTLMIPASLQECLRNADSYCWYTAQSRQAARDNFLRDAKPLLRSKLAPLLKLRRANGSEGIEIKPNGSEYRIFSAGSDELHGKTNRRVSIDEAWKFDFLGGAQLMQAIVPTFTTTAGQIWIISTAGTADSEFFLDWIAKGRAAVEQGARTGIAYFECSIPADVDPADLAKAHLRESLLELIFDNHPAYGHTLKVSAVRAALDQLGPGEFARAYGNFWTQNAALPVLSPTDIGACLERRPPPLWAMPGEAGTVALGMAVAPDDGDAAILAAWYDPAALDPAALAEGQRGRLTVAVVAADTGVGWLIPRLAQLCEAWEPLGVAYNDYGPAAAAGDQARRAGLPVTGLSGRDYATACAGLKTAIGLRALTIQPDPALDAALPGLARRNLGDAWVWDQRTSTASIAPIVAATVAKWLVEHSEPFQVR